MKNHIDMLIFHTAICAGASQISPDGRTEIAYANFCSPRRKKRSGMGIRMDIRLLQENEIQMAVYTAQQIYEMCVRPYVRSQQEADWFYGYVRVENLWQEMHEGRLIMWGAFDGGRMCAVSAMQTVGHITMLYVRPECAGHRIGTKLLNYMCAYAQGILHKDRVTINVMPTAVAPYFYKRGFAVMQQMPRTDAYLSLERMTAWKLQKQELVTYEPKCVSPLVIAALAAGVLLFSFVVIAGVTIFYNI